ncbi:MAG: type II toxin-antitoxin system RelE family toxin [Candidatus Acidiferrum sp.]
MKTVFRTSFARDLKRLKNKSVLKRVQKAIELVESADELLTVGDIKKMGGSEGFYRIRVGDYRIGIAVEEDTVEFVRCLPRRDLYRFVP